jgi:hypothetical protein
VSSGLQCKLVINQTYIATSVLKALISSHSPLTRSLGRTYQLISCHSEAHDAAFAL